MRQYPTREPKTAEWRSPISGVRRFFQVGTSQRFGRLGSHKVARRNPARNRALWPPRASIEYYLFELTEIDHFLVALHGYKDNLKTASADDN
jgi:hypothetical protein